MLLTIIKWFLGTTVLLALAGGAVIFMIAAAKRRVKALQSDTHPMWAKSFETTEKEWYDLSWAGSNPYGVIELTFVLGRMESEYAAAMRAASSFYGQTKFLLKRLRLPSAIVFYFMSKAYAKIAELKRYHADAKEKQPIDLEVIGAPYFMATGLGIPGSTEVALAYLHEAEAELNAEAAGGVVKAPSSPIDKGLIYSKLWHLTREQAYRSKVASAGLTRDHGAKQPGQMWRIARHMGMSSVDELYEWLSV